MGYKEEVLYTKGGEALARDVQRQWYPIRMDTQGDGV